MNLYVKVLFSRKHEVNFYQIIINKTLHQYNKNINFEIKKIIFKRFAESDCLLYVCSLIVILSLLDLL